jgi:glycosyltransferase involved in cell wall biosynthesis
MKISCVIPAYNEAENIGQTIALVKPYVDEIIVVDDCSLDNTFAGAQKAGAIVLHHLINRGQGAALETGNLYALKHGADIIVHFDADNQFEAKEIPELINPIKNESYQVVFGSRFSGRPNNMPAFKKKVIMTLARQINYLFFGLKMRDPQSGFRALNREAALKIRINNDRMAHCSEILYKAHYYKFRLKEVPVSVTYHDFGQKISGGFKIIKDIIISKLSN